MISPNPLPLLSSTDLDLSATECPYRNLWSSVLEGAIVDYFGFDRRLHREAMAFFRTWRLDHIGGFRWICESLWDDPIAARDGLRRFLDRAVRRGGGQFPTIPDEEEVA